MIDVEVSTLMAAAPAQIAAVMFDPRRDPEWIGGAARSSLVSADPLAVGARVRRAGSFLGRPIAWTTSVEAYEPGRRLRMRFVEGPMKGGDVTYSLAPEGRSTRVFIRNRGPAPLPGLGWIVRSSVRKDLERLKAIVERRES